MLPVASEIISAVQENADLIPAQDVLPVAAIQIAEQDVMAGHHQITPSQNHLHVLVIKTVLVVIERAPRSETVLAIYRWGPEFDLVIYHPVHAPDGMGSVTSPRIHAPAMFQQIGQTISTRTGREKNPDLCHLSC